MLAPTLRRGLAILGATALAAVVVPLTITNTASAAPGDPVVTLQDGVNGCEGVVATPGSENTTKRLVAGNLEPGGTVTFQIGYPVDPTDANGRSTFVITDCVFIGDKAVAKYEVSFVPNTADYILTFQLTIPADAPVGAEYCNYAKTTAAPSNSQASNRKANPACFHIGGDLRIIKQATGDKTHTPLAGAAFTVTCTTAITIPPVVISGIGGTTVFNGTTYTVSGTSSTGIIAIAGPAGTPCTVTETSPPPGYDLPTVATFNYTIPVGSSQSVNYISDPRTKNTTSISTVASDATVGAAIHDTATLTGATANAGGTITFTAFGPSDPAVCTGTPVFTSAAIPVSGNGNYGSGDFTPTTAGNYYWIATYSGDTNNLGSAGTCGAAGETSTVGRQPTVIGTAASTATVGDPIHDTASLSGGTTNPVVGGTITFRAWANSTCSGDAAFTSAAITVSGNGQYSSGNFTPTTAGSYYWIASYSGDANNLGVTGTCGDAGETSGVGLRPTLIATAASSESVGAAIHDIATLSGATATASGSITFRAWANATCAGDPAFTSAAIAVNGNGNYGSGDFTPTTAGSYYWIAAYSGDGNNLPATGACGDAGETSTVGKLTTVVGTDATSADLGGAISDTATLTGAGADASGTITFNLYGPSDTADCSGPVVFTSTVAVTGSGTYHSQSFTPTTFGNYYWIAAYSGDDNNLGASGACGDEGETSVVSALAVSPTPTHSPESQSTQPLAVTGSGPVGKQIGWALVLLVLGGAVLLVGKRRGYRRAH